MLIYGSCMGNKHGEAIRVLGKMGDFYARWITCITILDGFCKKGRLNEDMNLLLDMKNNGTAYNILIVGYCRLGWLEESGKVM